MKRNLLILLVITALAMITCGNEPPAEFYEGTPEDSAAIIDELNAHAGFLNTYDVCTAAKCSVSMPAVSFPIIDSFYRADSPLVKQHITMLGDTVSVLKRFQDPWYTKDTTCTVYLFDTFTIISHYDWDKKYTGHYVLTIDTLIDSTQVPWDTTLDTIGVVLTTIDIDSSGGTGEITPVVCAEGLRHLFLEPVLVISYDTIIDGNDTSYQDTTVEFKEPREWVLKRVSYGNYFYPNEGAEYPIIGEVRITHASGSVDTIQDYVTDTTFTGHAMNRLKSIDSLLTFTNGEPLSVSMILSGIQVTSDMTLFFASCNGTRTQLVDGSGDFTVTGSGIVNLCFMVVLKDSYNYKVPQKDYLAMVWLVPVNVQ